MANERRFAYRNTGTAETPVWEKWFMKTIADAVLMSDSDGETKTIVDYVDEKIAELIGGAPATYDTLKEIADYIASHQEVADAITAAIGNKVDKEAGKGLSTNDYTNAEKEKLAGLTNYTHPTGDGNLHVPATGTDNAGKVLKAGATAGSASWESLTKADVGLGNVDNTADADKPVSTAQQTAINNAVKNKVDKVTGKQLSTEDYTTTEKEKLAALSTEDLEAAYEHSQAVHAPSNAQANVQADWNETSASSDAYIKNKPGAATRSTAGLMSATDKEKLDTLPEIYFAADLPAAAPAGSICFLV